MILRDIFVGLDRLQVSTEAGYAFTLRSRCLCHFLGRYVWKKQIRIPGFNRIVVELSKNAVSSFVVNSCQVACITIPLTRERFDDLRGDALHDFYIDCLTRGVDQFLVDFPEALAAIHEGIGLFRAGGYRNEWVEKTKRFRELGLTAVLSCRMTIERFHLRLAVLRSSKVIYDQEIFTSDPDEIAFAYRFKDVLVADGQILVVDRFKKPLLILSLQQIEANKEPNQPPQRNAGSRPSSDDSPASGTSSSLGPRG